MDARQIKFLVLIIVLAAILVGFSIYSVTFLLTNLNKALGTDDEILRPKPINFEIEKFEKLNLIK